LKISGGWVEKTRSWLNNFYTTISRAPDGFMPQQQGQRIIPVWQHIVMVMTYTPK
jgi:hypothetical protein